MNSSLLQEHPDALFFIRATHRESGERGPLTTTMTRQQTIDWRADDRDKSLYRLFRITLYIPNRKHNDPFWKPKPKKPAYAKFKHVQAINPDPDLQHRFVLELVRDEQERLITVPYSAENLRAMAERFSLSDKFYNDLPPFQYYRIPNNRKEFFRGISRLVSVNELSSIMLKAQPY